MQDIIPPKKRSIKDIPIPSDGRHRPTPTFRQPEKISEPQVVENDYLQPDTQETRQEKNFEPRQERPSQYFDQDINKKPIGKKKLILISTLVFAFLLTLVLISRESAKVYVYAKEVTQTSSVSIKLDYTPLELSVEKNLSIKATGEEKVTEKSKGKITIYNEYEESEQRLLKETRFESSNGLIFRIPNSVVVPGLTRDSKGNVVPGKLEVEVVADKAGEEYNIGPGRFTVPGFDGLPQFDAFYAVSDNSMSGGFDGIRKVVSQTDRENAEKTIKEQIKSDLLSQAKSKNTQDLIVVADESMITYEILGDKVEGNNVVISARGIINAAQFNLKDFSHAVAKSAIPQFSDSEVVKIQNIDELSISSSKIDGENSIKMDISGSMNFLWENDFESLKNTLAGTDKNKIGETVEMFPGITKISTEVSPFWSKNITDNTDKIKIIDSKN